MAYAVTIALVSVLFIDYMLPLKFVIFGFAAVIIFFTYSSKLTMNWEHYSEHVFQRRVFITALIIRLVYVIFIYYFYISETGEPHAYHKGDEGLYNGIARLWSDYGYEEFQDSIQNDVDFSDTGYCWWLGILYLIFGP